VWVAKIFTTCGIHCCRSIQHLAFLPFPGEDEGVITVTEPQVWTMMGVFTALMFGTLTIVSTLFVRVVRSEVGGLRTELGGIRGEVTMQVGGLHSEMNARFDAVNVKIDGLDRDVQLLMSREFGKERD
jgi:hypothetical protein